MVKAMKQINEFTDPRKFKFEDVVEQGSIDDALAWLQRQDLSVEHALDTPWARGALHLGIAAAQRDPAKAADVLEFCSSVTDYDVFWTHFRNEGDMVSEREVRQDFVAKMRKYLSQWTTKKEKIEELVEMVRDDERDLWMKRTKFEMRIAREFQKVIKTKSIDEAIAWLCHDYLSGHHADDVPTLTYAELTLRCAIVAHKRDPEKVSARDILDFVDSAVNYDHAWQKLRNHGDTEGEHDYRSDFAAEITQLLERSGAKTAEIERIIEDLMTDETNPWMKKGSPEWLEVQRSNAHGVMSVEDYIAQNEREFAAEAAQRRERKRERSKSK